MWAQVRSKRLVAVAISIVRDTVSRGCLNRGPDHQPHARPFIHRAFQPYDQPMAWNQPTIVRRLAIAFMLAATGCAGVGAPGERLRDSAELLAGLQSYESPEQARSRLPKAEWTIRVLQSVPADNKRPKYETKVASINWHECGQDGILSLSFVNERLYATVFRPPDFESCIKDLATRGFVDVPASRGDKRKVITGEHEGRRFVTVADTRLESEINAWIERYS